MLLELAVERGHGTVGKGVMVQWGKWVALSDS